MNSKRDDLMASLARKLHASGHKTDYTSHSHCIWEIDGIPFKVTASEDFNGRKLTGRVRFKIGSNSPKQCPEPKAGHDLDVVLALVLQRLAAEKLAWEDMKRREEKRRLTRDIAARMAKDVGLNEFDSKAPEGTERGTFRFEHLEVDEEQARAILAIATKRVA